MKQLSFKFILVILLLFSSEPVYAYLDPATGSVLLGMLSAILSAGVLLFERLKKSFHVATTRKRRVGQNEILLHCESATYLPLFEPLVSEFSKRGVKIDLYCTSNDEASTFEKYPNAKINVFEGQSIFRQILKSHSRIFLSTTPGLDVLGLQKSALFEKSVHVIHSPSDLHTYSFFSFDRYDAVLGCGDYQIKSMRRLESLRGYTGASRKLFSAPGLLYYDDFMSRMKSMDRDDENTLLVAPTWGHSSLIYHLNESVLKALARDYSKLIFRFHPQSRVSDREQLEKLLSILNSYSNVQIDTRPSSFFAISESTSMLTDISGIIIDFKILKPKSSLYFFSSFFDYSNKEGHWLPWEPFEVSFAKKHGVEIRDLESLRNLRSIKTLVGDTGTDFGIENVGRAAGPMASEIIKMLETK